MHIRTFRAASLQDALAEIRQQMGPEAAVLHTRQVRDGVLGWLGRTHVEVTAGLRERGAQTPIRHAARSAHHGPSGAPPAGTSEAERRPGGIAAEGAAQLTRRLLAAGVPSSVADQWLVQAGQRSEATLGFPSSTVSAARLEQALREHLSETLPCRGPLRVPAGQQRTVALVGPTGVGKTTTVAKLAAGFRLQQQRRVGLLTIDTYRIAAVQQLQAYAEIMELPMAVVESPEQMQRGLEELGDAELVLIDTAGRSPRGAARLSQLQQMLAAASPHETHLVVSATASVEAIRSALQGFAAVRPTATILTKLDETEQLAGVLAALPVSAPPLSYLTHGQQVPDDIATADAEALLSRLFAEEPAAAKTAA